MDDAILVSHDKAFLQDCLSEMKQYLQEQLGLSFNAKTQIVPIRNGVEYIGFRFYVNEHGGVIRKLSKKTKTRYRHRLKLMKREYANRIIDCDDVKQVLTTYRAHMSKWHCFKLQKTGFKEFCVEEEFK